VEITIHFAMGVPWGMAVTSHDVARLAGVSQPTVSRALRDQWGVSARTRRRVRDAARELGYVPLQAGRALSTQTAGRVGIVSAELSNPFYPALIEPLHDRLASIGFRTILVTDRGNEPVEIEPLIDGSLDGVILTTTELDSDLPEQLQRRGVPAVLVNRESTHASVDACVVDNFCGAEQVARLLASLGHRRIGAIFGPSTTSTGLERRVGFIQELERQHVDIDERLFYEGPFTDVTGSEGFKRIWEHRPTAVFCANDVIALGARSAAAALKVNVPGDLTLIGFDNIPMAGWDLFQLTTIGVNFDILAAKAIRLLMDRIRDPDVAPRREVLKPELVLRGSHSGPEITSVG
jgi:LacI family transcriptional regulator